MEETEESRRSRGKAGPRPTLDEQGTLYHTALEEWLKQGYKFKVSNPAGATTMKN